MEIKNLNTTVLLCGLCASLVFGFFTASVSADAPMFQHALEYQPPSPYKVVIHYDGELNRKHQSLVDKLKGAERGNTPGVNITVVRRDLSIEGPSNAENHENSLPRLELQYPSAMGNSDTIWAGPLNETSVKELLRSPVRQQIAEELLDRKAAVWVLLQGDNKRENERAMERLEEILSELEAELYVSVPDEQHEETSGEIYTDIDFSIILLDRKNPGEKVLVNTLLGLEHDLADYEDKPIVFPIYGRGVVKYALIGDGINKWTLRSTAEFLTDSCSSCQIGAVEPNTNLLMSADWDGRVEQLSYYENAQRRYGPVH